MVMAIIAILAAMLLPALTQAKSHAQRVQCGSRLGQLGIAFQAFAHDHNGLFPMQTPAQSGGSLEFVQSGSRLVGPFYFSYRHFQALSNELGQATKILVCPADYRPAARDFRVLQNDNLSYFVNVNSTVSAPGSILAGDRNLTNSTTSGFTTFHLGPGQNARWNGDLHRYRGNLLYADGHVADSRTLSMAANAGAATDLVLPTINPGLTQKGFSRSGSGNSLGQKTVGGSSRQEQPPAAASSASTKDKAPAAAAAESKQPSEKLNDPEAATVGLSVQGNQLPHQGISETSTAVPEPAKAPSTNGPKAEVASSAAPTPNDPMPPSSSSTVFAWSEDVFDLARKSVWLIYALFVAFAVTALYIRHRLRKKSQL